MGFNTKLAAEELNKKPLNQIEEDAAYAWASRSWVAFTNFNKNKDYRWFLAGEQYFFEACEHAACSDKNYAALIKEIKEKIDPVRNEAHLIIKKKSFV